MTQIEMDQLREMKWTFTAIKNFEHRSKEILKRLGVEIPNIQVLDGKPIAVGTVPIANATYQLIMSQFGRMAEILEVSVGASTGLSWLEAKGQPSAAALAIQGYTERGNSLDSLAELTYEELLRASDPLAYARRMDARAKAEQEAKAKAEAAALEAEK
jgi:hypothetical protein